MLYYDKTSDSFIESDIDECYAESIYDTLVWDMLFDEAYDNCKKAGFTSDMSQPLTENGEDIIPMTPTEFFMTQYGQGGFIESSADSDGYSAKASSGLDLFFRKPA